MQLDNADKNNKEYIHLNCNNLETFFKEQHSQVIERVNDVKVENSKYSYDIMVSSQDLKKEIEKLTQLRDDQNTKFDENVNKMIESNKNTTNSYEFIKNDFDVMKKKFTDLSEFIKVNSKILNLRM